MLNCALPTGSPADFPMVLTYHGNAGGDQRVWLNWSAPISVRGLEPRLEGLNLITRRAW